MKTNPTTSLDLNQLNRDLTNYTEPGYDIYFLHGWFTAYLSVPSDAEDNLFIPDYLIFNEEKIVDEKAFNSLVDKLLLFYTTLADSLYEYNKPIKPLVDLAKPNFFDPAAFSQEHKLNLLKWLYGYLAGFMASEMEISELETNGELVEEKFYPALFTLCIALFALNKQLAPAYSEVFGVDFNELLADLSSMWEVEDDPQSTEQLIAEAINELNLQEVLTAVNDIFYVIRSIEEVSVNESAAPKLLNKLVTKR